MTYREPPEPQRPQSQNVVQATGQVASDVIAGLKTSPLLLALILLNVLGIGAGVWILKDLTEISSKRFTEVTELTNKCFTILSEEIKELSRSRRDGRSDTDPGAGPG